MTSLDRRLILRGAAGVGAGLVLGAPLDTARAAGSTASARRLAVPALLRSGRPALTHGVQAGDPLAGSVMLWSRADRPARLIAEISRDPSFRTGVRRVRGPVVGPGTDFTGQMRVFGLPSATDLHYRITALDQHDHALASAPEIGRFRTAPTGREDIRFLWSGDIAGQGWGANPDLGGYRIVDAMRRRNAHFFLCSGDNCYADGPLQEKVTLPDGRVWRNIVTEAKQQVAQTLDQFRGQFQYNLLAENYRAFLAETAQVTQWDDHEVLNNWYPGEVLEDRPGYAPGTKVDTLARRSHRAFHEYIPVAPISPDKEGRIYRVIHHGPLLDLFILDMRTHKDPNTANLETVPDGGLLGETQTRWLLRELKRSKATWKVIANDLPLGLVVPDGKNQEAAANGDDGAPLGREHQIARILRTLHREGIRNHVWLTADVHYTAAHHYSPDRAAFRDFDPFWEFVSGPLNAGAFGPNTPDGTFGPKVVYSNTPPRAAASPLEGWQFFGEVEIDGHSRDLTVTLRDVEGAALFRKTLHPHRR